VRTPEDLRQLNECPTCESTDPAIFLMVGCGFKCDDISGWHAHQQRTTARPSSSETGDA
jgi:hypothetical protein